MFKSIGNKLNLTYHTYTDIIIHRYVIDSRSRNMTYIRETLMLLKKNLVHPFFELYFCTNYLNCTSSVNRKLILIQAYLN